MPRRVQSPSTYPHKCFTMPISHPQSSSLSRSSFGLLGAVLGSAGQTITDSALSYPLVRVHQAHTLPARMKTYQITSSAHHMVPHTGTILTPPTAQEHHGMLLHIVALTGDIRRDDTARTQTHTRRLALSRIGFLGLGRADLETDALERWAVRRRERRRHRLALGLRNSTSLRSLVSGFQGPACVVQIAMEGCSPCALG